MVLNGFVCKVGQNNSLDGRGLKAGCLVVLEDGMLVIVSTVL